MNLRGICERGLGGVGEEEHWIWQKYTALTDETPKKKYINKIFFAVLPANLESTSALHLCACHAVFWDWLPSQALRCLERSLPWLSKCNHLKTKPVLLPCLISFLLLNIYHYAFCFLVYLFSLSMVWRSPRADNALCPSQSCILEPSPWFSTHYLLMIDGMNLLIQCIWTAEDIVTLLFQKVFGGKGGRNLLFKLIPGLGEYSAPQ